MILLQSDAIKGKVILKMLKIMEREVQLENGYTCMAISNEKNPNQATSMNKNEFQKSFI